MLVSVNNPQYRKSMNSSICPSKGNAEVPNSRHKISYMAKVRQEDISQCFKSVSCIFLIFCKNNANLSKYNIPYLQTGESGLCIGKKRVSGMMNIYCGCEIGVLFHLKKLTMF